MTKELIKKMPHIVLAGRVNVGKSTLFNILSPDTQSMVMDKEGITRDSIHETVSIDGVLCQIIDTAGINTQAQDDRLQQLAIQAAYKEMAIADVVLLVIDGSRGIFEAERQLARWLHEQKISVIVVANKSDRGDFQEHWFEAISLGFQTIIPISAAHSRGITDLIEAISPYVSIKQGKSSKESGAKNDAKSMRIMLLGKPNAGKSALMNSILGYERSLVSDIAGTTREPIVEHISYYQEHLQFSDTAGVRKKASVSDVLEQAMVYSTLKALDAAHIVILVVDASEGHLSDQVLKLAFYVFQERYKGLMLVLTKWDLVTPTQEAVLKEDLLRYKHLIDKIQVVKTSSKTGKNIGRVVPLVHALAKRYQMVFDTHYLYRIFQTRLQRTPLVRNQTPLQILHVEQTRIAPPTLTITVPDPSLWNDSSVFFLEKLVRAEYDLKGVPIHCILSKVRSSKN